MDELNEYSDFDEISDETNFKMWRGHLENLQALADDIVLEIRAKQETLKAIKSAVIFCRENVLADLKKQHKEENE